MSAKVSVRGEAVMCTDHKRVQIAVTMSRRNKPISTFTMTVENEAEFERGLGHWFAAEFLEQLEEQRAWFFESETHPFQEELPF